MKDNGIDLAGLVRVGIKLAGLGLIIAGIIYSHTIFAAMYTLSGDYGFWQVTFSASFVGSYILAGLVLWLFPAAVTNTLVIRSSDANENASDWAQRLERVGISLLGLYLLYCGLSDMVFNVLQSRVEAAAYESMGQSGGSNYMPAHITTVLEIGFALVLLITPRGIVNLLHKLRSAGT